MIPAGVLVTVPPPLPPFVTVSAKVGTSKVAVTAVAPEIVTVQAPAPEHPPPLQPLKIDPESGVAVSVTAVPLVKFVVQFVPHAMPAGVLVTVPLPVPALVTVRANVGTSKVAVTAVAPEIVTVQAAVPEQPPPLQPPKVDPESGMAVNVTAVPLAKFVVQFAPHAMPAGVLVTVPLPVPAFVTVSAKVGTSKVAVTAVAPEIVTVQAAAPEQPPPLQPVKVEPVAGVAVSVTAAPLP